MLGLVVLLALSADLPMTTVARGPMSGIDQTREVVVRSSSEWEALWKSHSFSQPMPTLDFSTEMAAAVFLGGRATGGFGVNIVAARRDGDAVIIEYVEQRPGRDAIVTQVLTSPFHIVKLPRHEGPVRFQKQP